MLEQKIYYRDEHAYGAHVSHCYTTGITSCRVENNYSIIHLYLKTFVSETENVLMKENEEIQMSKSALKKQAAEMDALKNRIFELEKVWCTKLYSVDFYQTALIMVL